MRVLLLDKNTNFRQQILDRLTHDGHHALEATTFDAALKTVKEDCIDVVVIDIAVLEMGGVEWLSQIKDKSPESEVLVFTEASHIDTAVIAVQQGAFDYLLKPCSYEAFVTTLAKAAEHGRLHRDNIRLRAALKRNVQGPEIIGQSPGIQQLRELIDKVGPTESSVLVVGESGTGKELVTRALHRLSPRSNSPLVTINCAALQETLLESELFGHECGAFTEATEAKLGLLEVADGGTLFLDELGELPLPLQSKLLRVLEDGTMRRVGSNRETQVNVRIVAATNKNLQQEVHAGRFRNDLYYRINVLSIVIPPLRERRADIPLLTDEFLARSGRHTWRITEEAQEALSQYNWPGNVRELANLIEQVTTLCDGPEIALDSLPAPFGHAGHSRFSNRLEAFSMPDNLAELERLHVAAVLAREGGSKVRAAKALGISRRSLYRLIEKYKLNVTD